MKPTLRRTVFAVAAAAFLSVPALSVARFAVTQADIEDEALSTLFQDTGGIGQSGNAYAPSTAQNPIGDVATFGAPGAIAFMNNGGYYLNTPVSPVAWGFARAQRADITFNVPVESVSMAVRGTEANSTGPNGIFPWVGATALDPATATVSALDNGGNIIPGSTTAIQNLSFSNPALNEIVFTSAGLGEDIFGLAFENTNPSATSGLLLGGLGITPAPAPVPFLAPLGLAAFALGLLGFGARSLRRR